MPTTRIEQLLQLKDRVARLHQSCRFDQSGHVGRLVAKARARLERLDLRIARRISALAS